MSDKGSVFQKGGGGTNFEQSVQAAFLTTLIVKGNAPSIPPNEIIEIAFQTTNRGYETDDLLAIAKSSLGQHRILAQIKFNLSFTEKNETFHEVIAAFWKDFNNSSSFDKEKDRLLIIKSGLSKDERNHIKVLLNWAKTHSTELDFFSEVNRIKTKKDRLVIFRDSLKKANTGLALTNTELWEFLKCLDVLEYDFTNEGSIDETYFLNLIKLSKANTSEASEKEIWDGIISYVSKLNKDGGSITADSIQKQDIYKHFDPSRINPFFKSIEKLISDSEIILKPIKNTIADFHLIRDKAYELLIKSINQGQITIVTGNPGVGKSAAVKDVLKKEYFNASVFVFRADQFNSPHLAEVFSSQGINEPIQDIFSCISLISEKLIVIDSLEKLLEGDPENAFKQLLALLKEYPDVKIVTTARKYSIDLIYQKFGIDKNLIEVADIQPLNDDELKIIAKKFPRLQNILSNTKLKKLLESPKYLDFSISALTKSEDNFTNASLKEFKESLWNSLVKNSTNRTKGFPAKREDAFLEIAVRRAKEMKLFIKPRNVDEEAIDLLENDEIIFQSNQNRRYSPSHDILEDWALVKYVSSKYEEYSSPKELFTQLGNEPAIRRAFRLWVENEIMDGNSTINDLIKLSINENTIEKYWADELLIAIFKSEDCSSFFQVFENELLKDNAEFLNRCIHLIRTTCKESDHEKSDFSILLPIGSGWKEIILFIQLNITKLDGITLSIINLLCDWEYRLLFQKTVSEKETIAVKGIVLYCLKQIESNSDFWKQDDLKRKKAQLISLLFNLAKDAKQEITSLIERAFKAKEDRDNWELNSFYRGVINKCLSGLNIQTLTKELPELVVKTAWQEWKLRPIQPPPPGSITAIIGNTSLRNDECWGIEDKSHFFPSGIYKTPIYNLLCIHPVIGMKFIAEFINYSVEFYVKAKCEYKHEMSQVDVELNDGTVIKQWAAWELWAAYRGSSVTHYAIESLLMSLEKYLLDVSQQKTEISKKNLQYMFNYLLRNSNNVAISSVLTSVTIAFPEEVEEEMLPLLRLKEFYEWDLSRSTSEHSVLAPMDNEISFAQEERWKSNQLPHRKKYMRGLMDFILQYQFNIGNINKQIHSVFDKLKKQAEPDDLIWRKTLTEMDVRNHKIGEYDKELGGFPIQPEYEQEVTEYLSSEEDSFKSQSTSLTNSGILKRAYDNEEKITFEKWLECFNLYSPQKQLDLLYDRPLTLAFIGLRDFKEKLKKRQSKWCTETLIEATVEILKDAFSRNYGINRKVNLMEKEIALSSFHLLFQQITNRDEEKELITLTIYVLFAPFADHEVGKVIEYIRNIFFTHQPALGKKIWICLIKYAQFKKSNPYFYDSHDQAELNTAKEKEEEFIKKLASSKDLDLNLDEINLEQYEGSLLAKAFTMIPYDSDENIFPDFIKRFIPLLTNDLKIEENYSYNRSNKDRQIQFQEVHSIKQYLTKLLLNANKEFSQSVIDLIFDPIYEDDFVSGRMKNDLFGFASRIPEIVIYQLDDIVANSKDNTNNQKLIENFWTVWKHLFEKVKRSGQFYFTSTLLLDIKWKSESSHWSVLEGNKDFYYKMVQEFGNTNTRALINVFSTAGEKTFLPNGLTWLVDIYKNDTTNTQISSLRYPSAERLIKRLFYNHISEIKKNKNHVNDFIWLLNKMIDLGSSEAYFFREHVITYKQL